MNCLSKIFLTVAVSAAVCFTINKASAQQSIASWFCGPLVNGGGASPAPFTNNTANANVIVYPITKGAGVGGVMTGDAYGGNDWTNATLGTADTEANSIAGSNYVSWAVQAVPGYTLSFSTNFIFVHVSSTGPHTNEMQYSTDGVNYSDIASFTVASGTTSTVWTNILATNQILQNVPSSVTNYFRIVAWGATGTAGTWYIYDPLPASLSSATNVLGTNDFVINGAVNPIPPATSLATWFDGPLVNGGGAPPALYTNNTANPNVIVYPIAKGAGIGTPMTADAYGGNEWTNATLGTPDTEANSIAGSNYVTWAVQAATNYTVSFFTNFIFLHVSSTGPHTNAMQYSTDGVNYKDIASFTVASGTTSTVWTNILSTNQFLQNVPTTVTNYFRIVAWGATGTAGTWYIYDPLPSALASATNVLGTNDFVIDGGLFSILGVIAPTNLAITPLTQNVNAGQSPGFSVTASGSSASVSWYFVANSVTNPIVGATNLTLTINDALGANDGGYFAVLANAAGSATSAVATLTVNDPSIEIEPANSFGLLDGQVQFSVTAVGSTPLTYQWYFATPAGVLVAPVTDGHDFSDQAVISGSQTALLTIGNLQSGDLTNFVVVVTSPYGTQTSSGASILGINTATSVLAFWTFGGSNMIDVTTNPTCLSSPVPWLGVGTAQAVGTVNVPGTSPFLATTSADPSGGAGIYLFGMPIPQIGYSWGIGLGTLPLTSNLTNSIANSNKMSGIQFNVSTVGAKNIKFNYDARATQTASEFTRVQYTTNGTAWIDYPAATSFNGISGSGAAGWESYPLEDYGDNLPYDNYPSSLSTYFDFTGFPGVDNNPYFGVRIVLEYQSTGSYGIQQTNDYQGVGEAYGFNGDGGTMTYDLVGLYGDAITNNNIPPVISALTNAATLEIATNITTLDNVPVTVTFTVTGDAPANQFTYSAQSLNPSTVDPSFAFTPSAGGGCTMVVTPNPIAPNSAAAPILVTVTDIKGDSASAWFLLTLNTLYPSPGIAGLPATNTLANTSLSVPFMVSSPTDSVSQFTYSTSSGNNTVVPSPNVVVNNALNPTNPVVTITPASNQLGVAVINVTVNDNDSHEPKNTTVSIPFMVRPNTNIIAIDYFNYDNSGPLDSVSSGFWQHLSGFQHQMQVSSSASGGAVNVDTFNNTENVETSLLGAPYSTNATKAATLYYSFVLNLSQNTPPQANGTYITAFNDGSGITSDVEDLLVLGTNGVETAGDFRLGIADDVGATAADGTTSMVPIDLAPGTNYVVVTALNLATGQSTLWINPTDSASPSTVAPPDTGTIVYNISDFELRESGLNAGAVNISHLKVGTTFDSVFPSLHVQPAGNNVVVNWSDPTIGIQSATNILGPFTDVSPASPPYTNNISTNIMFFRFGH